MPNLLRSLNPCCSGQWSRTMLNKEEYGTPVGLNPCCSGQWSRTGLEKMMKADLGGLNPCCSGQWSRTVMNTADEFDFIDVLILVVVDNGLVPQHKHPMKKKYQSLNPCCSGQWSRTGKGDNNLHTQICLNPCCSGQWSRTFLRNSWTVHYHGS